MYGATLKPILSATERMQMILVAPPATLAKIDAILQGVEDAMSIPETDTRTVTFTQAAKRLGISRPTVYRLIKDGRLRTVKLCGVSRVVLSSMTDFVNEGVKR